MPSPNKMSRKRSPRVPVAALAAVAAAVLLLLGAKAARAPPPAAPGVAELRQELSDDAVGVVGAGAAQLQEPVAPARAPSAPPPSPPPPPPSPAVDKPAAARPELDKYYNEGERDYADEGGDDEHGAPGDAADGEDYEAEAVPEFIAAAERPAPGAAALAREYRLPPRASDGRGADSQSSPFLAALADCETLECVRAAHTLPRGAAKFGFPHFMIVGFQKAATTSLHHHLGKHPSLRSSSPKEPEHLSWECFYRLDRCSATRARANATRAYLRETLHLADFVAGGGATGHFESSTHYVRNGDRLVAQLRAHMPWLRVVFSLREPISRAASMLVHQLDKRLVANGKAGGCLADRPLGDCLLHESQISGNRAGASSTNYSYPVAKWAEGWPREQLFAVQYEELTSEEGESRVLAALKRFLGVDPAKPREGLGLSNARRFTIAPEGHPMARREYEALLAIVRPDAAALVATLEGEGLIESGAAWMARWEAVWDANLASCDGAGPDAACSIELS
jgi:hypothetical protein